jgi:soluble lytic murein transglycosylase-like protein
MIPDYALIAAANAAAQVWKIDPALVCALCEHESGGWNPWAIRYEPAFYLRYVKPMGLNETEAHARSFSYGLGQVMGQTARELGFNGKYLTELLDPAINLNFTCKKLSICLRNAKNDVRAALLKYNGGGNLGYPDLVLRHVQKYQSN